MTRLERVIEIVKQSRVGANRAWIYDENGNIKDDVVCGDILPYLEELKQYEIDVTDEYIEECLKNPNLIGFYSYNYNFNVDKDFVCKELQTDEGFVVLFSVHIGMAARNGFTNYFVCEFARQDQWFFFRERTAA